MTTLDEVQRMRLEGRTEQDISLVLQQQGVSSQEIANALSQTQIKEAVSAPESSSYQAPDSSSPDSALSPQQEYTSPQAPTPQGTQNSASMQPSILDQSQNDSQPQEMETLPPIQEPQTYPQDAYALDEQQNYQEPQDLDPGYNYDYPQPSGGISSDTIAEIAEQIISEKLSGLRNQIENSLDTRTTAETKLSSLSERLERIEKIIDRLQLSILQKIGQYTTSVSDLKKELSETQKTFKSSKLHPPHKSTKSKHKK
jgi:hypothetical protein